jgi:hypothetical protein
LWYGGNFKKNGVDLSYLGGECRTLDIDPDIISWIDLEDLVENNVGIKYVHALYYLLPNSSTFEEGLRRMSDDASVMEMASIGSKMRDVVVYIVNKDDDEMLVMEVSKKLASLYRGKIEGEKKKLTPRRAVKEKGKSGPLEEGEDKEGEENIDDSEGDDSEDESYNVSSELDDSVKCNEVDGQALNTVKSNEVVDSFSDYDDSEGELGQVNEHTDFKKFKWFVGLSFPNPLAFRDALKKYALVQGRNVKICVSDKKGNKGLEKAWSCMC